MFTESKLDPLKVRFTSEENDLLLVANGSALFIGPPKAASLAD